MIDGPSRALSMHTYIAQLNSTQCRRTREATQQKRNPSTYTPTHQPHTCTPCSYPHEVVEVGAGEEAVDVVDDVPAVHDLPEYVLCVVVVVVCGGCMDACISDWRWGVDGMAPPPTHTHHTRETHPQVLPGRLPAAAAALFHIVGEAGGRVAEVAEGEGVHHVEAHGAW